MTTADRFARWIARPENCTLALCLVAAFFALGWFLTGEWSPLP